MRARHFIIACAAWVVTAHAANASVLTYFSFNGSLSQPTVNQLARTPMVSQIGSDAIAGGQSGVAFTTADGQMIAAGKSMAFGGGVNDGNNALEFTFDPSASRHMVFSYDYRSSAPSATGSSYGPAGQGLYYAIGGSDPIFVLGSETFMRDSQWHRSSWDLSALIPGIGATAYVQIMMVPAPGADVGTLSYDNLQLAGDAALPGDVNGDGAVGFDDLLVLAQDFGETGSVAAGDVNRDGRIDFADLLVLAQHFGQTADANPGVSATDALTDRASAVVPEPLSPGACAIAAAIVLRGCRRMRVPRR